MIRIGIDLDNTIINYLESFKYYSKNKLNIDCYNLNSKEEIKKNIKKNYQIMNGQNYKILFIQIYLKLKYLKILKNFYFYAISINIMFT